MGIRRRKMILIRVTENEYSDILDCVNKMASFTALDSFNHYFRWLHHRFGNRLANDQPLEFSFFAFEGAKRRDVIKRSVI